jgi:hypothetical protein
VAELIDANIGPAFQLLADGQLRYLLYTPPGSGSRVCVKQWDVRAGLKHVVVGTGDITFYL